MNYLFNNVNLNNEQTPVNEARISYSNGNAQEFLDKGDIRVFDFDSRRYIMVDAKDIVKVVNSAWAKLSTEYRFFKRFLAASKVWYLEQWPQNQICDTMATDGGTNLFINATFVHSVCKYDRDKVFGILFHELMHNLLEHNKRELKKFGSFAEPHSKEADLRNICMDHEVNATMVVDKIVKKNFWEEMQGCYNEKYYGKRWEFIYDKDRDAIRDDIEDRAQRAREAQEEAMREAEDRLRENMGEVFDQLRETVDRLSDPNCSQEEIQEAMDELRRQIEERFGGDENNEGEDGEGSGEEQQPQGPEWSEEFEDGYKWGWNHAAKLLRDHTLEETVEILRSEGWDVSLDGMPTMAFESKNIFDDIDKLIKEARESNMHSQGAPDFTTRESGILTALQKVIDELNPNGHHGGGDDEQNPDMPQPPSLPVDRLGSRNGGNGGGGQRPNTTITPEDLEDLDRSNLPEEPEHNSRNNQRRSQGQGQNGGQQGGSQGGQQGGSQGGQQGGESGDEQEGSEGQQGGQNGGNQRNGQQGGQGGQQGDQEGGESGDEQEGSEGQGRNQGGDNQGGSQGSQQGGSQSGQQGGQNGGQGGNGNAPRGSHSEGGVETDNSNTETGGHAGQEGGENNREGDGETNGERRSSLEQLSDLINQMTNSNGLTDDTRNSLERLNDQITDALGGESASEQERRDAARGITDEQMEHISDTIDEVEDNVTGDRVSEQEREMDEQDHSGADGSGETPAGSILHIDEEQFSEQMTREGYSEDDAHEMGGSFSNTQEVDAQAARDEAREMAEQRGISDSAISVACDHVEKEMEVNEDLWDELVKMFLKSRSLGIGGKISLTKGGNAWGHHNHLWRGAVLPTAKKKKMAPQTVNILIDTFVIDGRLNNIFLSQTIALIKKFEYSGFRLTAFGGRMGSNGTLEIEFDELENLDAVIDKCVKHLDDASAGGGCDNFKVASEFIRNVHDEEPNSVFIIIGDGIWEFYGGSKNMYGPHWVRQNCPDAVDSIMFLVAFRDGYDAILKKNLRFMKNDESCKFKHLVAINANNVRT